MYLSLRNILCRCRMILSECDRYWLEVGLWGKNMRVEQIIVPSAVLLHTCTAYLTTPFAIRLHKGIGFQRQRKSHQTVFGKKDEGEEEREEEWLNLSDPIDFTDLEEKILDRDSINMGWIRAREPPQPKRRLDPLTDNELELIRRRKARLRQEEAKQRFADKWISFLSPLLTFIIPQKMTSSYGQVRKSRYVSTNLFTGRDSGRNLLVLMNIMAFAYQLATAVYYLPGFNRVLASSVAGDAISTSISNTLKWTRSDVIFRALASAGVAIYSVRGIAAHSLGPFFIDFAHQPYPLSHFQRHRYITSGFLHGSLVHLGMNLRALFSLPRWLENGIGRGVYLSSYLVAIVTGNIAHTFSTLGELPGRRSSSLAIGASGGICGLYGLMFVSLCKMNNSSAAQYVFKQMLWLVAFGYLVPNISNAAHAAHIGGFLGGAL
jgi:membrane associated rhomboid family serine protease